MPHFSPRTRGLDRSPYDKDSIHFLVYKSDVPLGVLSLVIGEKLPFEEFINIKHLREEGNKWCEVRKLAINPQYFSLRKEFIFTIIKTLYGYLKRNYFDFLFISITEKKGTNLNLYLKLGFKKIVEYPDPVLGNTIVICLETRKFSLAPLENLFQKRPEIAVHTSDSDKNYKEEMAVEILYKAILNYLVNHQPNALKISKENLSAFSLPFKALDFSHQSQQGRQLWLMEKTGVNLVEIVNTEFSIEKEAQGKIENLIGHCRMPLGIAGPLKVKGESANGVFYVPMATTEATIVQSYQIGMLATFKAGGINACVQKDEIHISPIFVLKTMHEANQFSSWIADHFREIKQVAEKTTQYGKLLGIDPLIIGRRVILKFAYTTGDAMGLNIINIATYHACEFISKQTSQGNFYLRSNYSSDKKASFNGLLNVYGKEVLTEAILSKNIIERFLRTTPQKMYDLYKSFSLGSQQTGMVGINAQYANALAAIYIACGQDVAQIVNANIGISTCEIMDNGDFYAALRLPSLVVGTVGGGTTSGTQKECLQLLGCYGPSSAKKFAEIVAATLLAGEIAICAAIASGNFIEPHLEGRKIKKEIVLPNLNG